MQTVFAGQANIVSLPIVKTDASPITTGTVNFYLKDKDGSNAGKWFRGSDESWQVALSIAGQASHDEDGHWSRSIPQSAWEYGTRYRLIGKESGNLHIPVGDDIIVRTRNLDRILNAWMIGIWRIKSGSSDTYELLDPDDGVTVILEMVLDTDTPYKSVTVKI
jgi:hypothetical protein